MNSVYATVDGRLSLVLQPHRSGYTLFELMIVLALILIVTAIAAPNLMESVRNGRVQEAAENVTEVLAAARRFAIDTGVDYHFRFEVGGQNVVAIPADAQLSIGNSNNADPDSADFVSLTAELPSTMFLRYSADSKSGSETLKGSAFGNLQNAGDLASKTWSEPILFRFDGSAETTTFRVMDEQQRSSDISVRGLTGAISTSGVFIMEEK